MKTIPSEWEFGLVGMVTSYPEWKRCQGSRSDPQRGFSLDNAGTEDNLRQAHSVEPSLPEALQEVR